MNFYVGNRAFPQPHEGGRGRRVEWAELEWRAAEYRRLRTALAMSRKDLSALTGLSISTLNQIPYLGQQRRVPSFRVLEVMRAELERRQAFEQAA